MSGSSQSISDTDAGLYWVLVLVVGPSVLVALVGAVEYVGGAGGLGAAVGLQIRVLTDPLFREGASVALGQVGTWDFWNGAEAGPRWRLVFQAGMIGVFAQHGCGPGTTPKGRRLRAVLICAPILWVLAYLPGELVAGELRCLLDSACGSADEGFLWAVAWREGVRAIVASLGVVLVVWNWERGLRGEDPAEAGEPENGASEGIDASSGER